MALSKERENNQKRLQSRDKNNDEQISPNEESAGSEQEDKRAFLQGEGRFKHQGISERKTGRRQRSRSRSFDRRKSSSHESNRNRKSRHHHRHHRHRLGIKRYSTQWFFQFNENSIETQLRITVGSK